MCRMARERVEAAHAVLAPFQIDQGVEAHIQIGAKVEVVVEAGVDRRRAEVSRRLVPGQVAL